MELQISCGVCTEVPAKEILRRKESGDWCRGYYVDTAGKNTKKIAEYIRNQLEEDKLHDQMTLREYEDPFKGSE